MPKNKIIPLSNTTLKIKYKGKKGKYKTGSHKIPRRKQ